MLFKPTNQAFIKKHPFRTCGSSMWNRVSVDRIAKCRPRIHSTTDFVQFWRTKLFFCQLEGELCLVPIQRMSNGAAEAIDVSIHNSDPVLGYYFFHDLQCFHYCCRTSTLPVLTAHRAWVIAATYCIHALRKDISAWVATAINTAAVRSSSGLIDIISVLIARQMDSFYFPYITDKKWQNQRYVLRLETSNQWQEPKNHSKTLTKPSEKQPFNPKIVHFRLLRALRY